MSVAYRTMVCDRISGRLRVAYVEMRVARGDRAVIPDLSAAFGVERGAIQDQLGPHPGTGFVDGKPVNQNGADRTARRQSIVPEKGRCERRQIGDADDGALALGV